jgi:hypothetical protein
MDYGGVILAAEPAPDVGKASGGELAREIEGDLARPNDLGKSAGRFQIARGERLKWRATQALISWTEGGLGSGISSMLLIH